MKDEKTLGKEMKKAVRTLQTVRLYKIKHFIFDFGGVMIGKTYVLKNLLEIIEHDLNICIPEKDSNPLIKKYKKGLSSGRITPNEFLQKIMGEYFHSFTDNEKTFQGKNPNIEYYVELWFNFYSKVSNISSEMEKIVKQLHDAGFTVSLMSNTDELHAKSNQLRGFYDLFDHLFLSNEVGLIKPDIEKYKYVLNKLGTKPKNCIFIDDKLINLIPAKELGMIVIRFESFEKFKQQLTLLGLKRIKPGLRHELQMRYSRYKSLKSNYEKVKRKYKKAKKDFIKQKPTSRKLLLKREQYEIRKEIYRRLKEEYKCEKQKKKEELEHKIDFT
jgi:epoxide hydrolase-like predicted phosphatase